MNTTNVKELERNAKNAVKDVEDDMQDVKEKSRHLKDSIKIVGSDIKENVEAIFHNSVDTLKGSFSDVQDSVANFCKKNPLKTVGIAMLAGFIFSRIVKK